MDHRRSRGCVRKGGGWVGVAEQGGGRVKQVSRCPDLRKLKALQLVAWEGLKYNRQGTGSVQLY